MKKIARILLFLLLILLPLLAVEVVAASNLAGSEAALSPLAGAEPSAPAACPAAPAGLPQSVEPAGEEFCVFYDSANTTADQANRAGTHAASYWTAYVDQMGFPAPEYSAVVVKFQVELKDAGTGESVNNCNGFAPFSSASITVFDECDASATLQPQMYQFLIGHEIYHKVQWAAGADNNPATNNVDSPWFFEGTARSMEDKVFASVDHWANSLSAPFSYYREVNNYLVAPNNDITSDPMRYKSALWWTYYSEQCGANMDVTRRGVDAFGALWNAALTANDIAALNNALGALGCPSFDTMFKEFTVANWTKDLTGLPDASYNYADEEEAGNPAIYGPLAPAAGGVINATTAASWNNQVISRYGAAYYRAAPQAGNCPVISATFHNDTGGPAFYHVITQNGAAYNTHVQGSGTDWTQSFLNNGVTNVVAVAGSLNNASQVDVTLSCANPVINIELPNTLAPAYVGPATSPDDIVVQVAVTNGSPTGPVVAGLTNADFKAEVGGAPALVTGGGFVQEEYFLLVDTPTQAANGPFDLEIFLEAPGTNTVLASDTASEAVIYDNTNNDHVIVTDVSSSMNADGKMTAAKNAANLFIDAGNSSEGLGLVSYNHDVVGTLGIQFATLPHRTSAHTAVNGYTPAGATSIGDGLNQAVTQRGASTTGNARCQFTLLSDGMENSALFWAGNAALQAAVVATGCPVMTIALGQASNELLMQQIATATGGVAYYNDVFVSAAGALDTEAVAVAAEQTELDLGNTYLFALCQAQHCQRLLSEHGIVSNPNEMVDHQFRVDESVTELRGVLDWAPTPIIIPEPGAVRQNLDFDLTLIAPDGTEFDPSQYAFESGVSGHVGYVIPKPEAGEWTARVTYHNEIANRSYQVLAYGQTDIAVQLLLPAGNGQSTGDHIPLYAIWLPGGEISATVKGPNSGAIITPMHHVKLYDDGQHNDGGAGDGFYAGIFTVDTAAPTAQPAPEPGADIVPPAVAEGAYQIHLVATMDGLRRETQGSYALAGGADATNDGIPDDYVAENCPGAPNSDADLDRLDCSDEFFAGTDPNNSDSDGGGESDHSEAVLHGSDPLNAPDDLIEAPDFLHTQAQNGSVLLTYDVKGEYVTVNGYRATSMNGPWTLIPDLPLAGEYTDSAVTNEADYYYCLQAVNAGNHWSAVVCSDAVTPSEDPIPPEARMLIDEGAPATEDVNVSLSFIPYEDEAGTGTVAFDDIAEMMISNDPALTGAAWQPFQQDVPWQLLPGAGLRTVYARFKDGHGNESVGTETASIELEGNLLYLPIVIK